MDEIRRVIDPDGREVVFGAGAFVHLARRRPWLLAHVEAILATVALPHHREHDPIARRERFYARHLLLPDRWLRVIVDYNDVPASVVTAFVDFDNPQERYR